MLLASSLLELEQDVVLEELGWLSISELLLVEVVDNILLLKIINPLGNPVHLDHLLLQLLDLPQQLRVVVQVLEQLVLLPRYQILVVGLQRVHRLVEVRVDLLPHLGLELGNHLFRGGGVGVVETVLLVHLRDQLRPLLGLGGVGLVGEPSLHVLVLLGLQVVLEFGFGSLLHFFLLYSIHLF